MTVLSDTLAALPEEFTKARQIWRTMGIWSPQAVEKTLVALVRSGNAERIRDKSANPWCQPFLYRRARNAHREAA